MTLTPTKTRSAEQTVKHDGLHAPWIPLLAVLTALAAFSLLSGWVCLLALAVSSAVVLASLLGPPGRGADRFAQAELERDAEKPVARVP